MNTTRRTLLKLGAYVTPAVLVTLPAVPTFAGRGSTSRSYSGKRLLPVPPDPGGPSRRNERARSIKKESQR